MTDTPTPTEAIVTEPFTREDRYIVVKRAHLSRSQARGLDALLSAHRIGTVDCVVVEHDWPEYEPTWAAIERRTTHTEATSVAPDGLREALYVIANVAIPRNAGRELAYDIAHDLKNMARAALSGAPRAPTAAEATEMVAIGIDGSRTVLRRNADGSWPVGAQMAFTAAPAEATSVEVLASALKAQTDLVARLCDAVDLEAEDIGGGEGSLTVLRLLGPNVAESRAALRAAAPDTEADDERPAIADDFFERADAYVGEKLVRKGKPQTDADHVADAGNMDTSR